MGQALRKVKPPPPPSRPVAPPPAPPAPPPSEIVSAAPNAAPTATAAVRRRPAAGDVRPAPPEPQKIIDPAAAEPNDGKEWNRPDPNFVSMSQRVVGSIRTRPGGSKEHPPSAIHDDSSRPLPIDRHTTLDSGPDEVTVRAPGTLNHAHLRELFLLHQGEVGEGKKAEPMDVESLAERFKVDVEILRKVLHHTALVHFEMPAAAAARPSSQNKWKT